jgi:putative two-component system response regulator
MTHHKVLVVDDERGVRESIRILLKNRYDVSMAVSGSDAIARLPKVRPDVVLLDLRLGDMHGIEVLQNIKTMDPDIEVILVTAYASIDTARKALHLGAFDYITKPFDPHELENVVARGIERRDETLQSSATLEAIQHDLQSLRQEVERAKNRISTHVRDTIYALLMSLQLRDAYSGQHSISVLWLVDQFAQYMGLPQSDLMRLKRAALVHDLGKVGIPEDILNKPEPLNDADRAAMQHHPVLSAEIISNVEALADLVPIVRAHHERWDGNGYPDGRAGEDIPWEAQLLAICDAVHAMSGDRCYRARLPEDEIRRELVRQRGKQFKPEFVDMLLDSLLIHEIYMAEEAGVMVLKLEQIREVLEEAPELEADNPLVDEDHLPDLIRLDSQRV